MLLLSIHSKFLLASFGVIETAVGSQLTKSIYEVDQVTSMGIFKGGGPIHEKGHTKTVQKHPPGCMPCS